MKMIIYSIDVVVSRKHARIEDRVHYAEYWQPGDLGCPEVEVEIQLVSALIFLELDFVYFLTQVNHLRNL